MLGIVLVVVGLIYYFGIGLLAVELDWEVNTLVFILGYVVIAIIITILMKGKASKCPKCGKTFGMKEISCKTVGSRATTMDVERKVKNNKGEVIRTYTESVPATQYIYDCVDECKFCGHRQEVRREATYRD